MVQFDDPPSVNDSFMFPLLDLVDLVDRCSEDGGCLLCPSLSGCRNLLQRILGVNVDWDKRFGPLLGFRER